jgi:hypothetical protein
MYEDDWETWEDDEYYYDDYYEWDMMVKFMKRRTTFLKKQRAGAVAPKRGKQRILKKQRQIGKSRGKDGKVIKKGSVASIP